MLLKCAEMAVRSRPPGKRRRAPKPWLIRPTVCPLAPLERSRPYPAHTGRVAAGNGGGFGTSSKPQFVGFHHWGSATAAMIGLRTIGLAAADPMMIYCLAPSRLAAITRKDL